MCYTYAIECFFELNNYKLSLVSQLSQVSLLHWMFFGFYTMYMIIFSLQQKIIVYTLNIIIEYTIRVCNYFVEEKLHYLILIIAVHYVGN